ncbi:hypothetical protein D3C73_185450 [compost metagenome]
MHIDVSKLCTYYCRVSSDKDEQANSIETQTNGLKAYAKEHKMIIADSGIFCKRNQEDEPRQGYIDEGFSGAKSKKYRRAYQQMISDAKKGLFKTILTKSVSRFGRNVKDMLITIDELETYGVGVWFEDIKAYSLNGPDKIRIQLFATLAEEESRSKSDSVQWAKKEAAKKGVWAGREPYGYDIYKMGTDPKLDRFMKGRLVINPKESEIVVEIFELYLSGWGFNKIAKHLEVDRGIPSKRGGIWTGSHVHGIIMNSIYTGHTTLHRTRKSNINMGLIEKIPEEKQIKIDDESLRIISDETYKLAQIERESRPKVKNMLKGVDSRFSTAHLFSNLIKCGNCNGSFRKKVQKTTRQTHHYYYCRNHESYGKEICRYRNLQREEELLDWVREEFRERMNSSSVDDYFFEKLIENRYQSIDFESLSKSHRQRLIELEQEKETNFRILTKGIISDEEFEERNNAIIAEKQKLTSEITRFESINKEIDELKIQYRSYLQELKSLDLDNLSNIIIRKFIDKITISTNEEGITDKHIDWKLLDDNQMSILENNAEFKKEIEEEERLAETMTWEEAHSKDYIANS